MKKLSLYGILAIAIAFAFYACQDLSTGTSGTGSTAMVQTTQASIVHPSYDVQLATYVSPTLESLAGFNPGGLEVLFPCPPPPPPPGGGNKGGGNNGGGSQTFTPPPPGCGSSTWTDPDGHSHTFTPPPPPPGGGNSNTLGGGDGGSHTFTPPNGGGNSNTITIGNGKHPIELPFIPFNLNLTSTEITAIQTLAQTYFNCIQAVMTADRPQMLKVVQTENAAVQGTMDSLRKGLITRKVAQAEINYYDQTARTQLLAISEDPALCVCLKAYLDGVRATLTAAQQAIWDAYVASLKGFCFTTTTPVK